MDNQKTNAWAVVTGACGGIGKCFAEALFKQGYKLILADLSEEKLSELRHDLLNQSDAEGVQSQDRIRIRRCDLTDASQLSDFIGELETHNDIEVLINNAGFGALINFDELAAEQHEAMIAVHVTAPMKLTRAVLPSMKGNDRGHIINVASLGAFAPCAQAVMYAATKAFLVTFSEALQEEMVGTGVRVQALCPGFVKTGFHAVETMKNFHSRSVPESLWTSPEHVVAHSLKSLQRNRVVVIPGWRSRTLGTMMRMIMVRPFVKVIMRPKTTADTI